MSEYEKGLIPKSIREYEKTSYPIAYELFGGIDRNTDINGMKGINILRTEMFLDSENVLMNNTDKNIFYLEAPTGSGKSNMSMSISTPASITCVATSTTSDILLILSIISFRS